MMLSVPPLVKLPTTSSSPPRCVAAIDTICVSSASTLGKTVGSSAFSDRNIANARLRTASAAGPGSYTYAHVRPSRHGMSRARIASSAAKTRSSVQP
jgi:hypothetical protein